MSAADLLAIFLEEMAAKNSRFFANLTIDPTGLEISEVTGLLDVPVTAASPLGIEDAATESTTFAKIPQIRCEALRLPYCKSIGYNITAYPNLLGKETNTEKKSSLCQYEFYRIQQREHFFFI